ncbi:hypothetical protein K3495_g8872 [Podosphaera aphanis]|nr:hypothetical protein K3495_g8872 [Podosphaera aphanis]
MPATGTEYHVTKGQAAAIFVLGTKHIPWLSTWRDLGACTNENSYASLESMMSTLRVIDGHRLTLPNHNHMINHPNQTFAMHANNSKDGTNDDCRRCKHRHKNRECFKEHPELAVGPAGERWLARRALGRDGDRSERVYTVNGIDSDSGSEAGMNDVAIAATAAALNTTIAIYDTGASHHFVSCETMFRDISTRNNPIKFDQAVGSTLLTKQSTARVSIGGITFDLRETLYSPKP